MKEADTSNIILITFFTFIWFQTNVIFLCFLDKNLIFGFYNKYFWVENKIYLLKMKK